MCNGLKMLLRILILALIVVLALFSILCARRQIHYFPMGGEITISDKFETDSGHYIIALQGEGGAHPAQFVLFCTQAQYESVIVGDTVNCERYQNQATYSGIVHKIR